MAASIRNLLTACGLMLLAGCAGKSYVVLLENPDGSTGAVVVKGSKGEQLIEQARHGAALDGASKPAAVSEADIQRDFGGAMAARPLLPERFLLYFASGGAQLTADSLALLPTIVDKPKRVPILEIMRFNGIVRKLILEGSDEKLIAAIRIGKEEGMQLFNDSIYGFVMKEYISRATAFEVSPNVEELKMMIKGIQVKGPAIL